MSFFGRINDKIIGSMTTKNDQRKCGETKRNLKEEVYFYTLLLSNYTFTNVILL